MKPAPFPIDIVGYGVCMPTTTQPASNILELEQARVQQQLAGLTPSFRERLMSQLGLETIVCEEHSCSRERAREAATQALARAAVCGRDVALIIDYSTYAADAPRLWSLGHAIQNDIQALHAMVLGAHGSGCCGLHIALRAAQAFLQSETGPRVALLVASDRAPDGGRVCLPISIMADAASALVVSRADSPWATLARVHAVHVHSEGRYVDLLSSTDASPAITIDAAVFERELAPIHFVILNRVLTRALDQCVLTRNAISALVYPNTTQLDRQSASRALGFGYESLLGPGPAHLGHAFANDLIINAQALLDGTQTHTRYSAWLATGSGFTWGAAIVERV